MAAGFTRRTFVKAVGGAGLSLPAVMPRLARAASANGKLNLAGIGVGGKGWSDVAFTSKGQNVVALCDVDEHRLGRAARKYKGAKTYTDWRRLLENKAIDACTISTPDHMHAPIALSAIRRGKHVYVQKPLTHSVHEARQLAAAAREAGVVTQMGIQGHSGADHKRMMKLIRDGVIGKVREVHIWTDRPVWPQGMERPDGSDPVPNHLHWDNWLGVAPDRPYHGAYINGRSAYHPFVWRGWLDFGTGALGDIGCHALDHPVSALALGLPSSVRSEGPEPNGESYPKWGIIRYTFPETPHTAGPLKLVWYDGGKKPPRGILPEANRPEKLPGNGQVFVGEKGVLADGIEPMLQPDSRFGEDAVPDVEGDDHYMQWTRACLGEDETSAPIAEYAGPLTETVLLGNIAIRYRDQTLEWDAERMRFSNLSEANQHVRRDYREGWEVDGLSG